LKLTHPPHTISENPQETGKDCARNPHPHSARYYQKTPGNQHGTWKIFVEFKNEDEQASDDARSHPPPPPHPMSGLSLRATFHPPLYGPYSMGRLTLFPAHISHYVTLKHLFFATAGIVLSFPSLPRTFCESAFAGASADHDTFSVRYRESAIGSFFFSFLFGGVGNGAHGGISFVVFLLSAGLLNEI